MRYVAGYSPPDQFYIYTIGEILDPPNLPVRYMGPDMVLGALDREQMEHLHKQIGKTLGFASGVTSEK